jgi:zinc transporter ZupT
MGLLIQTAILTFGMLAICALPLIFSRTQKWSALFFLIGTGALFGICAFDLLPDVIEIGGPTCLTITLLVGLAYSVVHLLHLRHHQNDPEATHHHHAHSFTTFFVSIFTHCFASGILLAISRNYSEKLALAVFLALLAHKGYECLIFVSLMLQQHFSRRRNYAYIAIYCMALPLGAGLTFLFQAQISQTLAIYVSSVAVGTLVGCLIFDFIIPCYHQVRRQWLQVGWVIFGLVLTSLLMGH